MDPRDVFVIGGTVRHLPPSGKCVLLLERGNWLLRKPPLASAACMKNEIPVTGVPVRPVPAGSAPIQSYRR